MGFQYVIEHMEEDEDTPKLIPPWVELEYAHMRMLAEAGSHVYFTHLSKSSSDALSRAFSDPQTTDSTWSQLAAGTGYECSVLELMKQKGIPVERACLLDPKGEKDLSPEDGDGRFDMFLFGGILGDDPPRDRTAELRVLGFPGRRLGPVQMTTDTALGVTKLVVQDKIPLDQIPYIDFPTIRFNAKESVEMPFRYIEENGQPKLPPGMRQLLHEDLNKAFDF